MKQTIQLHLLIDVFFCFDVRNWNEFKVHFHSQTGEILWNSCQPFSCYYGTDSSKWTNDIHKRIALWSRLFSRNSDTRLKGHMSPGNKDRWFPWRIFSIHNNYTGKELLVHKCFEFAFRENSNDRNNFASLILIEGGFGLCGLLYLPDACLFYVGLLLGHKYHLFWASPSK